MDQDETLTGINDLPNNHGLGAQSKFAIPKSDDKIDVHYYSSWDLPLNTASMSWDHERGNTLPNIFCSHL